MCSCLCTLQQACPGDTHACAAWVLTRGPHAHPMHAPHTGEGGLVGTPQQQRPQGIAVGPRSANSGDAAGPGGPGGGAPGVPWRRHQDSLEAFMTEAGSPGGCVPPAGSPGMRKEGQVGGWEGQGGVEGVCARWWGWRC